MPTIAALLEEISTFAAAHMTPDILHGQPHILRVLKYAQLVNEQLQGDPVIIRAAVLLHDIGHTTERKRHNESGARLASGFLASRNAPPADIALLSECILSHSRQYAQQQPVSPEAKVLYDADGMDLFGAWGLMRGLLSCGLRGEGYECMARKLQWRLGQRDNFFSSRAREFAADHCRIIEDYARLFTAQADTLAYLPEIGG